MQNKRWALAILLIVGFLYRVRLLDIQTWQQESFSWPAILIFIVGAIISFLIAYVVITMLKLRDAWYIGTLILAGNTLCTLIGHKLADRPNFDDFWGGFVAGGMEAALLYGALYGAQEVWSGGKSE